MTESFRLSALAGFAALGLAACSSAVQHSAGGNATQPAPAQAQQQSGKKPVKPADVHFMTGMVGHHAQAVLIAGWAPSHGASPELQRLAERIVVGQRDEIALMRDGRIVQRGTWHDLVERPADPFVREFVAAQSREART